MSGRRAARVDANQPEIVRELRRVPGVSVACTHTVGNGFPDLVIGFRGAAYLIEIKKSAAEQLTGPEFGFHMSWKGHVAVAYTAEDVLREIGAIA